MANLTVAVIGGTGKEGSGLALRWAAAGLEVIIGSRERTKAERAASELNARLGREVIRGLGNHDAAAEADVVVLSVPYAAHRAILTDIQPALSGKTLIDVTAPVDPEQPGRVRLPEGDSAALEAQAFLGEQVLVVAAFQNVAAGHLQNPDHEIDSHVLVCGDDTDAKEQAIELARLAGMRALDAGPLANAVVVEGLTSVLIWINRRYQVKGAGVRITGMET